MIIDALDVKYSHQIVGVGESAVDLLIRVDDDFLRKHVPVEKGRAATLSIPEFDRLLALCPSPPMHVPGGSAANTIRALAKLGVRCAFISRLGADEAGEVFLSNLQRHGVDQYIQRYSEVPTKKVIGFISPDGQTTSIGVKVVFPALAPPIREVSQADWVYFETWRLDGTSYVQEAMHQAASAGAKISLTLSSVARILEHKEALLTLIPNYVDLLFCNEHEATALTDLPAQEACFSLQTFCPLVVVTLGARGSLIGHQGRVHSISPFAARPIDTMGAGDHFAAGFLYGMLHHFSLSVCAAIGNRLGAAAVEVMGSQLSPRSWREIYAFLRTLPQQ